MRGKAAAVAEDTAAAMDARSAAVPLAPMLTAKLAYGSVALSRLRALSAVPCSARLRGGHAVAALARAMAAKRFAAEVAKAPERGRPRGMVTEDRATLATPA